MSQAPSSVPATQTSGWQSIDDAISEAPAIRALPVRTPGAHRPEPLLLAADRDFFAARVVATPRHQLDQSQGLPRCTTVLSEPECA